MDMKREKEYLVMGELLEVRRYLTGTGAAVNAPVWKEAGGRHGLSGLAGGFDAAVPFLRVGTGERVAEVASTRPAERHGKRYGGRGVRQVPAAFAVFL
ncbi:hypothetical protein [Desulfosporosinus metallidurans]|uniref:Uncharacterized protein n=1 Tax=Desulfosporosinus metallidurans TaxID=1888891 RepID=A0A1Q8QG82_9FIRM|nr:hypothetical protein [Desulfosporosinus metallidurans]OLN26350.1 hypothetical protein DSOL_5010 [Desulfosporosinus metallidurans]